jgi:hypothetical protein
MALNLQTILSRCTCKTGCRLWPGARTAAGIPQASDGAKRRGLNLRREVYTLAVGPIPEGHEVVMDCEVPTCLEPGHMLAMTKSERMRRLGKAGRLSTPAFVAARAKAAQDRSDFSMEKAAEMRAKRQAGAKLEALAAEFGLSVDMASRICRGEAWKTDQPAPQIKVTRLPGCPSRSRFEPPPWFRGEFSREWQELRALPTQAQA